MIQLAVGLSIKGFEGELPHGIFSLKFCRVELSKILDKTLKQNTHSSNNVVNKIITCIIYFYTIKWLKFNIPQVFTANWSIPRS